MTVAVPSVFQSSNLSLAWGQVLIHALRTERTRTPAVVSISGFAGSLPAEDKELREAVDAVLDLHRKNTVATSGMMIFPYDLWRKRGSPDWSSFHSLCVNRFVPRLKARDQRNRLGTYFERMMNFTGVRGGVSKSVDQLGFVIELLKKDRWPRESALQLSCFDPAKDHTGQPVRGFPCLQQVGISHDGDKSIALHALYPTQYIFDRGYGNYLGLCHLGSYIAAQTNLQFVGLNCYIGDPQHGDVNKSELSSLVNLIKRRSTELQ